MQVNFWMHHHFQDRDRSNQFWRLTVSWQPIFRLESKESLLVTSTTKSVTHTEPGIKTSVLMRPLKVQSRWLVHLLSSSLPSVYRWMVHKRVITTIWWLKTIILEWDLFHFKQLVTVIYWITWSSSESLIWHLFCLFQEGHCSICQWLFFHCPSGGHEI